MENLSYIYGRNVSREMFTTIPALLDSRASLTPDKAANIFRMAKHGDPDEITRDVITFSDLADKSLRLAASFLHMGLQPHDRIVIVGSTCPEFSFVEYACARLSVLMIRLSTRLITTSVLMDILTRYRPKALVIDDVKAKESMNALWPGLLDMDSAGRASRYDVASLDHLLYLREKNTPTGNWKDVEGLCMMDNDTARVMDIQALQDPDDPAAVFPTSGSTGTPKFVVHSHFSIFAGIHAVSESLLNHLDNDFKYVCDRPFSWIGGTSMMSVSSGATVVTTEPSIGMGPQGTKVFMDLIREEEATDAMCLPYYLYDMMRAVEMGKAELPPLLQSVVTGGEQIPKSVIEFSTKSFRNLSLGYISTEAGPISANAERTNITDNEAISWMDACLQLRSRSPMTLGRLYLEVQLGTYT